MKKFLRHVLYRLMVGALVFISGMTVYAATSAVSSMEIDSISMDVQEQRHQTEALANERQTRGSTRSSWTSWLFPSSRTASTEAAADLQKSEKLLNNVKVFPSPSGETLSMSFRLNKGADVSIKLMDALGNELINLFDQKLEEGIQNHSFEVTQKLNPGFYFVRVTAGSETVVKRISIR